MLFQLDSHRHIIIGCRHLECDIDLIKPEGTLLSPSQENIKYLGNSITGPYSGHWGALLLKLFLLLIFIFSLKL